MCVCWCVHPVINNGAAVVIELSLACDVGVVSKMYSFLFFGKQQQQIPCDVDSNVEPSESDRSSIYLLILMCMYTYMLCIYAEIDCHFHFSLWHVHTTLSYYYYTPIVVISFLSSERAPVAISLSRVPPIRLRRAIVCLIARSAVPHPSVHANNYHVDRTVQVYVHMYNNI